MALNAGGKLCPLTPSNIHTSKEIQSITAPFTAFRANQRLIDRAIPEIATSSGELQARLVANASEIC